MTLNCGPGVAPLTKREIEGIGYNRYLRHNRRILKTLVPFAITFILAMVFAFVTQDEIVDWVQAGIMAGLMILGVIPMYFVMLRGMKVGKQFRESYEKEHGPLGENE